MTVTDRSRAGSNQSLKSPVKAASTANLTLSGEQTVDTVALTDGDRVLAKNQTTGAENGIYLVRTGSWERAPDWDGSDDVVTGTLVFCPGGSTNALKLFRVSTSGDITIGTTSVAFGTAATFS
jgi:phage-related tail fiber protein